MASEAATVYKVGEDLIFDKSLREIRKQQQGNMGSIKFDPYSEEFKNAELQTTDFALGRADLYSFALQATAIRKQLAAASQTCN